MVQRVQQEAPRVHRHWARRVEYLVVVVVSIICSLASAHAVWWFFSSALNWIDPLQPAVTVLWAVGFTGLGFVISRGVAHRVQHKQHLGVVLLVAFLFELVETGCCFVMAAYSIQRIPWLPTFSGWLLSVITLLCYVLLPVTPWFTLGLAWFEVSLDRERHGYQPPVSAPASVPAARPSSIPPSASPSTSALSLYGPGYQGSSMSQTFPMGGGSLSPSPGFTQPQASYPSASVPASGSGSQVLSQSLQQPLQQPQPGQPAERERGLGRLMSPLTSFFGRGSQSGSQSPEVQSYQPPPAQAAPVGSGPVK